MIVVGIAFRLLAGIIPDRYSYLTRIRLALSLITLTSFLLAGVPVTQAGTSISLSKSTSINAQELQSYLSYQTNHPQALVPLEDFLNTNSWLEYSAAPNRFSKDSIIWLRLKLSVDSIPQNIILAIEDRLVAKVDLYLLKGREETLNDNLGATVPIGQRPNQTSSLAQHLIFNEAGNYTLLLKVPGRDAHRVATRLSLWNATNYFADKHSSQSFHKGWQIGVLTLLSLMQILALIIYRRTLWAYCSFFTISALLIVLFREGSFFDWLGWHSNWWVIKGFWLSTVALYVFGILIARQILCIERQLMSSGQGRGLAAIAAINALGFAPLLLADANGASKIGWALTTINLTTFIFILLIGGKKLQLGISAKIGSGIAWGLFVLSCAFMLISSLHTSIISPSVALNLMVIGVITTSIWLYLFTVSETIRKHGRSLRAQKQLTGHLTWVSHLTDEARTSLNLVVGTADLLYGQLKPHQQEHAAIIRREAKRLKHLANNIQDLTVLDGYRTQAESTSVRFDSMLAELKKTALTPFTIRYDRGTPFAWIGDASRWSHTLDTLLDCSLSTNSILDINVVVKVERDIDTSPPILGMHWISTSVLEYSPEVLELHNIRKSLSGNKAEKLFGLQLALFFCKSFIESQNGSFQITLSPNKKSLQFDLSWPIHVDTSEQARFESALQQLNQLTVAIDKDSNSDLIKYLREELTYVINPPENKSNIKPDLYITDNLQRKPLQLKPCHIAVVDMPLELLNKFPNTIRLDSYSSPSDTVHHLVSRIVGEQIKLVDHNCEIRALVVEDDRESRRIIGKLLSNLGVEVHYAVDGLQGLELANKELFDVIFVDCGIPLITCITLIGHVHKSSDCPNNQTPLVAVTPHRTCANGERLSNAGASDIIHKPVSSKSIESVISKIKKSSTKAKMLD
ncbi:response regulator [Microbulbifer epialgicus]|uniref:Response regulator n=1 Tax=Microbulbifer epialgicus TaxID=393907 RepID=A0ABV4NVD9_9GAMM